MPETLVIDRLAVALDLAAAPERAQALTGRVRDRVARDLAGRLARWIDAEAGGERLVFIDRLEVDLMASSAWSDDVIADHLAERLALALAARREDPATVFFRDRPEFLAAFLLSAVDGSAWSRWWFAAEFDGLRPLGASAIVRTLVVNEGEVGMAALARMTADAAQRLVSSLAAGDAAILLRWIARRPALNEPPLAEAWRWSAALEPEPDADARPWLGALIASERRAPASAGGDTLATMAELWRLRRVSRALAPAVAHLTAPLAFLRALAARAGVSTRWLDGRAEHDGDLAAIAADIRDTVRDRASDAAAGPGQAPAPAGEAAPIRTRFGGAVVLLNLMCRLAWPDRQREALVRQHVRAPEELVRALALAVIARALSPAEARAVMTDRALLAAVGLTDARRVLQRRRSAATAFSIEGGARGLLAALRSRLPGLTHSTPRYLRRNVLSLPAEVAVDAGVVHVALGTAPLDVLLVLAGYKRGSCLLPGGPRVEVRDAAHA
jgi:hypothetical protein